MAKTVKIKLTTTRMVEIPLEDLPKDFIKHCKRIIRKNIFSYFKKENGKKYMVWNIATDFSFFVEQRDYEENSGSYLFAWNKYCDQFCRTMEYNPSENPFAGNGQFISHMVGAGIYSVIEEVFHGTDEEILINEETMLNLLERLEDIKDINMVDWL